MSAGRNAALVVVERRVSYPKAPPRTGERALGYETLRRESTPPLTKQGRCHSIVGTGVETSRACTLETVVWAP
jgi:hypothetical protein